MIFVVVIVSLLAAFINAVAIIMMRRASGSRLPHELFNRKIFWEIAKRKLWLASVGLQLIAFLLQAVALNYGSLILVEPLMTMVLVFLMLLLHFRYDVPASRREWLAVGLVVVGLIMTLSAARPGGGHLVYDGSDWVITVGVVVAIIAGCIWVMRRSDSARVRAAFGGIAAATNIGLTAGLTKLAVEQANKGFVNLATSWELYAVIASGLVMVVILQSVFASGPLVISQPIIEIVNPIVSGIIAVVIFHNVVSTSPTAIAVAIPGLLLAVVGLSLIGGSTRFQRPSLTNAPSHI